ncbi:hypothetical protein K4420_002648 [Salmonella enterica]|nr:hypothetical protein [Salmonella enterica]
MEDVVKATSRSSDLLEEISLASGEQSKGVSQIGVAVTQMEKTTQQNAVLLEKSATATESLREQAVQLVSAVSVFRVTAIPHGVIVPVELRLQPLVKAIAGSSKNLRLSHSGYRGFTGCHDAHTDSF